MFERLYNTRLTIAAVQKTFSPAVNEKRKSCKCKAPYTKLTSQLKSQIDQVVQEKSFKSFLVFINETICGTYPQSPITGTTA